MSRYFRLLFFILPVLLTSDVWATPVRVSIGTHAGKPGETVEVPVFTEGATGQEVLAYKIVISFNPVILKYKAVSVKGTVTESWGRPVVNAQEDRLTIVGGGIAAISGDGKFLIISFDILPDAVIGTSSTLSFAQVRLNEGIPEAVTTNGVLKVTREGGSGGAIQLSTGTTSAESGETVTLPISISGALGNGILSFRIVLTYDPKILTVKGASFEGTVAENWGSPVVSSREGEVTISGSGTSSLNQDGVLIKARFEIPSDAPAGSRSTVSFREVSLNEGKLQATTSNGAITVSVPPSGPLTLSIEEIPVQVSDSVAVPVIISGAQGRDILAFRITLVYNSRVATFVDIMTRGTVLEGWTSPAFRAEHDTLTLAAAGVSPIEQDGELIRLIFVISPGAQHGIKSPLSFLTTAFESLTQPGEFSATTQNGAFVVADGSSAVEEEEGMVSSDLPEHDSLEQNYPNPFNPVTTIRYTVSEPAYVRLAIYDTTGRLVRTLKDEQQPLGKYAVQWDGKDGYGVNIASGVYLYRITSDQYTATKKMTRVK